MHRWTIIKIVPARNRVSIKLNPSRSSACADTCFLHSSGKATNIHLCTYMYHTTLLEERREGRMSNNRLVLHCQSIYKSTSLKQLIFYEDKTIRRHANSTYVMKLTRTSTKHEDSDMFVNTSRAIFSNKIAFTLCL